MPSVLPSPPSVHCPVPPTTLSLLLSLSHSLSLSHATTLARSLTSAQQKATAELSQVLIDREKRYNQCQV